MFYFVVVLMIVAASVLLHYAARLPDLRFVRPFAKIGGVVAVAVWTLLNSYHTVTAGYVGIVYEFGAIVAQRGDGLQWTLPWQGLRSASARVQGHSFQKLDSFSAETQDVFVSATLNVQVSPKDIQALYRDVGPDYFEILVRPRVFQAFKDETVKYRSVEIAPNRETIRQAVRSRLSRELAVHSIKVEDLLIDNIDFRKEFKDAIEAKQIATQRALEEEQKIVSEKHRAQQNRERAEGEGDARLTIAKKEAEANKVLSESITPALTAYLTVLKLAPNAQVIMLPSNQPFILGGDVLKAKTQ